MCNLVSGRPILSNVAGRLSTLSSLVVGVYTHVMPEAVLTANMYDCCITPAASECLFVASLRLFTGARLQAASPPGLAVGRQPPAGGAAHGTHTGCDLRRNAFPTRRSQHRVPRASVLLAWTVLYFGMLCTPMKVQVPSLGASY